jgi:catechol 2,3-dioxygenase-like lactoylglutathione lyase family enzyme
VRDLQRSSGFYSELFAMRVVAGGAHPGRVVLSREGRVRLALYLHAATSMPPVARIAAKVESLEAAREMVWDLGIATLADFAHPGSVESRPNRNSFVIADPDGHEIRFSE